MKITKKKLERIISEEVNDIFENSAALLKQYNELNSQIPTAKRGEFTKEVVGKVGTRQTMADLPTLIAIAKKYAFNPSKEGDKTYQGDQVAAKPVAKPQAKANNTTPAQKILASVTTRFKKANPQAVQKIIELQTMLVQLKLAPAKLKNGKPFVDGIFGKSTIAAISNIYR